MSRGRGRPAAGSGLILDDILTAGLALLDESGEQGLSMRALASRLGVTPMSLYNHVADRAGLLRALSDRVYGQVLDGVAQEADRQAQLREILLRCQQAVSRHPHLTLAIFAAPEAFAGVTRAITERLRSLLLDLTPNAELWLAILVDHAHGCGLPASMTQDGSGQATAGLYQRALDCLLGAMSNKA